MPSNTVLDPAGTTIKTTHNNNTPMKGTNVVTQSILPFSLSLSTICHLVMFNDFKLSIARLYLSIPYDPKSSPFDSLITVHCAHK